MIINHKSLILYERNNKAVHMKNSTFYHIFHIFVELYIIIYSNKISYKSVMAVNALKLTANAVKLMLREDQIMKAVDEVTENIKNYNNLTDLTVLETLKDFCIRHQMPIHTAKMYRNIALYNFYINNLVAAERTMEESIAILKKENCSELLVPYYSEMGLIHFYKHEYINAKEYYEEVEQLLLKNVKVTDEVKYLHYYRFGILLSNMQEYEVSRDKFEMALIYANNDVNIGMTTMNIGLLYKRQKDLKTALRYYSKALCLIGDKDSVSKSIVYNNISEVYKILGQYEKALNYIEKAFACIGNCDIAKQFVFFYTFTEIKILMGEGQCVIDEFFKFLDNVGDFLLYRGFVIEGINRMTILAAEDEKILKRLENTVIKLIDNYARDNEEYKEEFKACLRNIKSCLNNR